MSICSLLMIFEFCVCVCVCVFVVIHEATCTCSWRRYEIKSTIPSHYRMYIMYFVFMSKNYTLYVQCIYMTFCTHKSDIPYTGYFPGVCISRNENFCEDCTRKVAALGTGM